MEIENQTPFPARLLQIDRTAENVQAVVVVKSTFQQDTRGRFVPSAEQVPILEKRLETPFGIFHSDCFIRKEGVDLCVLGTVRPSRPSRMSRVTLSIDSHHSELSVFGDRRWVLSGGGLRSSDPVLFDEMPLAYARAYGGTTEHDYEAVTWPDNPVGRGYYLSAEKAEGQPLPNIESVQGPMVRSWNDQPPVAGWAPYPQFWGMRAKEGVRVTDPQQTLGFRIKSRLNNNAHSSLILSGVHPDSVIRIRGLRDQEMVVPIPEIWPVVATDVGGRRGRAGAKVDGIFVWADAGYVTLTHRIHFSYEYHKGERRHARLTNIAGARKV